MAVGGLDDHRIADSDGCAVLWRIGGDDAKGGRPVRLFARIILAAVGISLRLDALPCDSNRNHCGGGGRLRKVSRWPLADDFDRELHYRPDPDRFGLRGFSFHRSVRW